MSQMSKVLREQLYSLSNDAPLMPEVEFLIPLFEIQKRDSHLPTADDFLIEYFELKDGFHLICYPFEGRNVHEGMGALIAKRLSRLIPISFSIGMNDYGFELLSDKKIDVDRLITNDIFSEDKLIEDIQASMNAVEIQ